MINVPTLQRLPACDDKKLQPHGPRELHQNAIHPGNGAQRLLLQNVGPAGVHRIKISNIPQLPLDLRLSLARREHPQQYPKADDQQHDEEQDWRHAFPRYTCSTCSKSAAGKAIPDIFSFSASRGRIPVAENEPITWPVSVTPCFSKTKMSCMLTTSSSMPVISLRCVTRRVPSLRRAICTTMEMAEAICWRMAFSGTFRLAMSAMVSSREIASRGLLA